ncbi:hypothetical protein C8R43DRAFT_1048768 [Mycena crocata]|nr:hypothetical protein C8R43DRAFT_1048768 [Mycena crocata]
MLVAGLGSALSILSCLVLYRRQINHASSTMCDRACNGLPHWRSRGNAPDAWHRASACPTSALSTTPGVRTRVRRLRHTRWTPIRGVVELPRYMPCSFGSLSPRIKTPLRFWIRTPFNPVSPPAGLFPGTVMSFRREAYLVESVVGRGVRGPRGIATGWICAPSLSTPRGARRLSAGPRDLLRNSTQTTLRLS